MNKFALTNCSLVVTNVGDPVSHASVLVSDGRIIDVVTGAPPAGYKIVDTKGRLVTPGLVDAHTHAVFAGDRTDEFVMRGQGKTYQEIAAAGGGILSTVRATRELDGDQLFAAATKNAEMMLRCGTTTAEIKSGYGLATLQELKMLEVTNRIGTETPLDVVATFLGVHAVPPEFADNKPAYMDLVIDEMIPLVHDTGTASFVDIFVEQGYFDANDARRLAAAIPSSMRLRMHVDQFSTGGAELAAEIGAATADHLEQTTDAGIEALAKSNVVPVVLPASVFCLGLNKYPDARKMLDLGLPVVLASDFNPGSAPSPSLPFSMSLAVMKMGMTPLEALQGCTVNAARALGLADVGILATGAKADIAVWDVERVEELPYFVGAPLVHSVYKDGELVVPGPNRV